MCLQKFCAVSDMVFCGIMCLIGMVCKSIYSELSLIEVALWVFEYFDL